MKRALETPGLKACLGERLDAFFMVVLPADRDKATLYVLASGFADKAGVNP